MTASKVLLSMATETARNIVLAKFSSLVCELSDVRNPKTILAVRQP